MTQTSLLPAAYNQCAHYIAMAGYRSYSFLCMVLRIHLRNQAKPCVVRCAKSGSRYCDRNSGWCSSLPYPIMPGAQQLRMIFLYSLTKLDRYLWTTWSRLLLQWEVVQVMQACRAQQDLLPWVQYCTNALLQSGTMLCYVEVLLGSPQDWLPVPYKPTLSFLFLTVTSPLRNFSETQLGK